MVKVRCRGGGGRADRCPSLWSLAVGRAEVRSYEPVSEGWGAINRVIVKETSICLDECYGTL